MKVEQTFQPFWKPRKPKVSIDKPIKLIELFAGYGSQLMSLKRLGANVESHLCCEFDKFAVDSFNAAHGTDYPTMDIRDLHAKDLDITDKEHYSYVMTYSFPCCLAGTMIDTNKGFVDVKDIKVGDLVLTHKNRYRAVTEVMSRTAPNYYIIDIGGQCLHLTENHPVYVKRDGDNDLQWVQVKDLKVGDKVSLNIPENPSDCINYTDEELWLLGYMLMRGNRFGSGSAKEGGIYINTPPEKTTDIFNLAKKCYGENYVTLESDSNYIKVTSQKAIKAFFNFDIDANDLSDGQARSILDGILSCISIKEECDEDGTVSCQFECFSKKVALNIQKLVLKAYGTFCPISSTYNEYEYKEKLSPLPLLWRGHFKKVINKNDTDKVFEPISYIEKVSHEVEVFNFSVEEDETYTCDNIIVHNCTDLSLAGKRAGMSKGSGTRSGLLWEVERILTECVEQNLELPDVLMLENVPQVISDKNRADFDDWLHFLEKLGYHNFYDILNAKDYGIAQNRERFFMMSFLSDVDYEFPKPIPLKPRLKDYLDETVDEKYYLKSEKAKKLIGQLMERGELENLEGLA